MLINYFCSGFNTENSFCPELAEQLEKDLTGTERIVYIPGYNTPKAFNKYILAFTEHFRKLGIVSTMWSILHLIWMKKKIKKTVTNSNLVMLMGGYPFLQQELYFSKGLTPILQNYSRVILRFNVGATNMSKYIIIIPFSEKYPNFDIRPGMNLSGISIYPHNNFEGETILDKVDVV